MERSGSGVRVRPGAKCAAAQDVGSGPKTLLDRRSSSICASLSLFVLLLITGTLAYGRADAVACQIAKLAELPVTLDGSRALVTAKINSQDAKLIIDSGAFFSQLTASTATDLKLKLAAAPFGMVVRGVKGSVGDIAVTKVGAFSLGKATFHDVEFLVGGTEPGFSGLLGENLLHTRDVEYDLAQSTVRIMAPENCDNVPLSYWATDSKPVQVISLIPESQTVAEATGSAIARKTGRGQVSRPVGLVYLNGVKLRALFDSGAPSTLVSLKAAAGAGITRASPGVVPNGTTVGIGRGSFATYIAPLSSFKIGEEEIRNSRIQIGDFDDEDHTEVILGMDFFLAHRIYVANSQEKIYLTYNGGPVFSLATHQESGGDATQEKHADIQSDAPGTQSAVDYSRQGAVYAARREFALALPLLTKACELAPDNAEYRNQRGQVYLQTGQRDAALRDFDESVKLNPGDVRARLMRAEIFLAEGKKESALADLDAADALLSPAAGERYQMSSMYERADRPRQAVEQISRWITAHPDDAYFGAALNRRCWIRALDGTELTLALDDCNGALRRAERASPLFAEATDSRALVYLRSGNCASAIEDYDATLKIRSASAWSLYGRGLCRRHLGNVAAGDEDMARAKALSPQIDGEFARHGIVP